MNTRRWIAGTVAGALLLIGGVLGGLIAGFAQGQSAGSEAQQQTDQSQGKEVEQSPNLHGSIQVPENSQRQREADENAALQQLGKISQDQAQQAELGDENGSLIYDVELSNGMEVQVDAGNAQVLAAGKTDTESPDGEETSGEIGDHDSNEQGSGTPSSGTQESWAPEQSGPAITAP